MSCHVLSCLVVRRIIQLLLRAVRSDPYRGYDPLKIWGSLCYSGIVAYHDRFSSTEFMNTLTADLVPASNRARADDLIKIISTSTVEELGEFPGLDKVSILFVNMTAGIKAMILKDKTRVKVN